MGVGGLDIGDMRGKYRKDVLPFSLVAGEVMEFKSDMNGIVMRG